MSGFRVPPRTVKRIRELRYLDGLSCPAVSRIVGVGVGTVNNIAPGKPGKVPNHLVREAFLSSNMTATQVAWSLGWMSGREKADGSRVKRALGLSPDVSGSTGRKSFRRMIDAEQAELIAEACGVAGWSVLPDEQELAA
jgi:hypothetical protein